MRKLIPLLIAGIFAYYPTFAKNNEKVSISEYTSVYTFYFGRNGEPRVKEDFTVAAEATGTNAEVFIPLFYNENLEYEGPWTKEAYKVSCGSVFGDGIFYSDLKTCVYSFDLSKIGQEGVFKARRKTSDLRYFTAQYLTFGYPVKKRTLEFHIPDWLTIDFEEFNFEGYRIEKSEDQERSGTVVKFVAYDLPAYDKGPFLPGKAHIYPHLIPIVRQYEYKGSRIPFMAGTKDLYAWYAGLVEQVKEDRTPYQSEVKRIIAQCTTEQEKIEGLYYWVQDNIRYIAFEDGIAGFKPESSQKVFSDRYGDCKGMANLLKNMLIEAGFDARLSWIGTNHLPYSYKTPSLVVDNHMICTVISNKDTLLLDATEKFIGLKDVAERLQGKEVLVENGRNYFTYQVPQLPAKRNRVKKLYKASIKDKQVVGKGEFTLQGEMRTRILNTCNDVRSENTEIFLKQRLIGENKDMIVQELTYSALNDRKNPFNLKFDFEGTQLLQEFNGEYYIQPMLSHYFGAIEEAEERISFLDFGEKIDRETEFRLRIPKGYKLSYRPENFSLSNKQFQLQLSYSLEGSEVVCKQRILIPEGKISRKELAHWNEALKALETRINEQLILSKI